MNVVRARLVGCIDLRTTTACFRFRQAGINAEFLNRIRIRKNANLSIDRLIIVHAVQRKIIVPGPQSIAEIAEPPERPNRAAGVSPWEFVTPLLPALASPWLKKVESVSCAVMSRLTPGVRSARFVKLRSRRGSSVI